MLLKLDVAPTQRNQHILKETLFGHRAVVSVDRVPQHNNSPPPVSEGKLLTVGMIGFPNVGKSTLVDALLGRKQVSFSFLSPHQYQHQLLLQHKHQHQFSDLVLRWYHQPLGVISYKGQKHGLRKVQGNDTLLFQGGKPQGHSEQLQTFSVTRLLRSQC